MCGIGGLVGFDGPEPAAARLSRALAHRGPDGDGCYGDRGVALVHRRLAVLDPSPAGRQPMQTPDGRFVVVHNGEIYNFRAVADALSREPPGFRPRTGTDAEVVLHAFARWGAAAVERFRGMFAFGIWDAREQRLFVARDRLGVKPVYYWSDGARLVFASELRALLATDCVPRRLDAVGLDQYLTYQAVPAPRTLVEHVWSLPPAHTLTMRAGAPPVVAPYWDALAAAGTSRCEEDPHAVLAAIGERLRESIALHLVSDVPVATYLSGGIDSSAIVSLAREAGVVPRTFTVVCAGQAGQEAATAREVAAAFGAEHTEVPLSPARMVEQLPDALASVDHATGDGVNAYLISRAVRDAGITVALSGIGGDELFGGYPMFARLRATRRLFGAWGRAPRAMRLTAASAYRLCARASVATEKIAGMLETDGHVGALAPVSRHVIPRRHRDELLASPWRAAGRAPDPYESMLRTACAAAPAAGFEACMSYAELRTYMHDVLLRDADQMNMANGVEVRVPLLDHRLVEYMLSLSDTARTPGGSPKRLLVEALTRPLPATAVHRRKCGFTLPFDPWMRGPLRAFCEVRLARLGERGPFRPDQLRQYWNDFLARRPTVTWSRAWLLVALDEWLERNGIGVGL